MNRERMGTGIDWLLVFVLFYAATLLIHHVHNAEFLSEYPNMPAWLSPAVVYGAWLAVIAVGGAGYVLVRMKYRLTGLAVLAVYALSSFDGLGHYLLAPASAHSVAMHVTIWLEVSTGAFLLAILAGTALKGRKHAA